MHFFGCARLYRVECRELGLSKLALGLIKIHLLPLSAPYALSFVCSPSRHSIDPDESSASVRLYSAVSRCQSTTVRRNSVLNGGKTRAATCRPHVCSLHEFKVYGAGRTGIAPAPCGCGACCRSLSG
jgi:hypothetical protein